MDIVHLPPTSPFAKAVFKQIRPHIPRHVWPQTVVHAKFRVAPDGFSLLGSFEDLPSSYAAEARTWVAKAGIALVLASPAGPAAARMFQALRWRDVCLYALVPLLFAIPLSSTLWDEAMRWAAAVFAADVAGLLLALLALIGRRAQLAEVRFSADIPAPGLRLAVLAEALEAQPPAPEELGPLE